PVRLGRFFLFSVLQIRGGHPPGGQGRARSPEVKRPSHTHFFLARIAPKVFRWLDRRGPTRSHPEHGSQALQSRWYCTPCVWESRSLPEFFSKTPRRSSEPRGVPFPA